MAEMRRRAVRAMKMRRIVFWAGLVAAFVVLAVLGFWLDVLWTVWVTRTFG